MSSFKPGSSMDRRLIRYLHGELPAADVHRLRSELARDPALQRRLDELHRIWQGLGGAPPPTPAPFFVPRMQRVADQTRAMTLTRGMALGATPPWAGAITAAALVAGIAIGVGLGRMPQVGGRVESMPPPAPSRAAAGASAPQPAATAAPATPQGEPVEIAAMPSPAPSAPPSRATPRAALGATSGHAPANGPSAGETSFGGGTTLAEEYWQALENDYGEESSAASPSER
jgi:hypothetical protein